MITQSAVDQLLLQMNTAQLQKYNVLCKQPKDKLKAWLPFIIIELVSLFLVVWIIGIIGIIIGLFYAPWNLADENEVILRFNYDLAKRILEEK